MSSAIEPAPVGGPSVRLPYDPADPRIPWRARTRDPDTGHWLDEYGNRLDKRSWRVPYITIEDWKKKTYKQQVREYERFRESVLKETGFDIATERTPPRWEPRDAVPVESGMTSPVAQSSPGIGQVRPPTLTSPTSAPAMPVISTLPSDLESPTALLEMMFEHVQERGRPDLHKQGRRPKIFPWAAHWPAMVARAVGTEERRTVKKAREALDEEWGKREAAGTNGERKSRWRGCSRTRGIGVPRGYHEPI